MRGQSFYIIKKALRGHEIEELYEPSVIETGADESENEQYHYQEHHTIGDFLRIGTTLICRFSHLSHIFRLMRFMIVCLYDTT